MPTKPENLSSTRRPASRLEHADGVRPPRSAENRTGVYDRTRGAEAQARRGWRDGSRAVRSEAKRDVSPKMERVRSLLAESARVKLATAEVCGEAIAAAVSVLEQCFRRGGKLLLCGNGGSAADCQHMAAELVSRLSKEFDRPALPAIALTTDTSFLTAFANDVGYAGIFSRQLSALGQPGDVLVAISTSGNSPNVIAAVETAHGLGMKTIALTGMGGAALGKMAQVLIAVPSQDTQHIQESHLAVEHILCGLVEESLFGSSAG